MVIDVIRAETLAGELLEVEVFFVRGVIGSDDAELTAARLDLAELFRNRRERFRPGDRFEFAADADHRRLQAVRVIVEIERVAAFDAEELAVDAGAIAVVAANDLFVANAERRLAAVGTVRADGSDVLHFPGTRLVAISAAGERSDRADVDALAAFVALQVIAFVRRDERNGSAVDDAESADPHAFVADANAAEAENAARAVIENYRGPLLLVDVEFGFGEAAFAGAVAEHHVLQFALAALVADRAVEGVVGQQEFERVLAGGSHLCGVGMDYHAVADGQRTRHLQLRHFFHFHETHSAGSLKGVAFVVAERRNLDARAFGRFDDKGAGRRFELPAVDCKFHQISHWILFSFCLRAGSAFGCIRGGRDRRLQ